ncbi:OmpH family outer membrane protein [Sphingomonas solaris]|uniref:OmpH family outer membrane protein n=1 Tax=Alterirhizorhabdus solaris TaxID=2529389 RepID=A0A558QV31_9SPHN|nr:OmpH family outer membrane protein [Sphingomonas solaris]TVV70912.1 OmpH family outer membrane protein [Sphingomonas solaris]
MKTMLKALAATVLVASPLLPAAAQVAAGQGVAVVDFEKAINDTAAFKAATTAIQTQYKPQIDAFNARSQAINTELAPAQTEIQTLQQNPATAKATLDAKVNAYRTRAQTAQAELGRLAQPFGRPTAFAREQVAEKVEPALRAAMAAKRVNLVINPEAVILATPGGDITPDLTAQLNATVKTVSTTPPANWQPGQRQPAGR